MEKSGAEISPESNQENLPGLDSYICSTAFPDGRSPSSSPDGQTTAASSQGLALAKVSRRRVKAPASTTPATFGRKCSESDLSRDFRLGLESKLAQRLDTGGSMEYLMRWKRKITPARRPYFQLVASARPISDSESIGSPTGYNTPRATDGTNGGPNQAGGALSYDVQLTGFPTCAAQDVKNCGLKESAVARKEAGHAQPLTEIVQLCGWEKTPQASDGQGGVMEIRPGTTGKYKLRDFAHLAGWKTAMANDVIRRGSVEPGDKTLNNQVALAGWPTTTTRDSKSEGKDVDNRTGSPSLPALALGVIIELFLVPTGRRVVLAPEFSLWLMGFPDAWSRTAPGAKDWREAQAALELECLKDRETLSSPPLPPSL